MTKNSKHPLISWEYVLLTARFLLGYMLIQYGYNKLAGHQFGVSAEIASQPLDSVSGFDLFWYFFDHQPIKSFIGLSQIISGLLVMINRTVIVGALMSLPIWMTIMVLDITFMPAPMANAFVWRLSFYILLDLLLLWQYRTRIAGLFTDRNMPVISHPKLPNWVYLTLPASVILLEVVGTLPRVVQHLMTDPDGAIEHFRNLIDLIP